MKTNLITLFVFLFCLICLNNLIAQDCERPNDYQAFNVNNIRTTLNNSAVLIENDNNGIGFENANFQINATTLYANGLWFGALDDQGNLKISAESYNSTSESQFTSGPYPFQGNPNPTTCSNYNRFFKVTRSQIEAHLADFNDNQIINDPIPNIFGWPGKGNPEFESTNGFSLPSMNGNFAPFHDQNNDGFYNPNDGDFPLPDAVDQNNIPDETMWSIYNDVISEQSLGIEIQMTVWAFYCTDSEVISNTIFTSHKIINRSGENLSDMRIGSWTDFDIGCPIDDYLGSIPSQNSFYGYNQFARDEQSCSPFVSLSREQTMSLTFLNQELSSFINFFSSSSNNIEPGRLDPETPNEFYNYLNNSWKDGTPLTFGGSGYNVAGGASTSFAFSGNPNEFDEWSMTSAFLPGADQRGLGVVNIDDFNAGETYVLDIAYSSHHLNLETSFELIGPMMDNITELQNIYDNRFQTTCTQLEVCEEDCVWPGDTNADGIADYRDLLEIGLAFSDEGPTRLGPINWNPFGADDWPNSFNGINVKHADCNADGLIDDKDFRITRDFYDQTNENYDPASVCNEGDQLTLERLFPQGNDTITSFSFIVYLITLDYDQPLYGLSFEVEYDTNYFEQVTPSLSNIWVGEDSLETIRYFVGTADNPFENSGDFAIVKTNGNNSSVKNGSIGSINLTAKTDIPIFFSPNTTLKFKNVRAILNDGTTVPFGGTTKNLVFEALTPTINISNNLPISIYPNPVADKTHVDFNGFSADLVHLMDTKGRLLKAIPTNQLDVIEIDLSDIPNGVYFLKVIGEKEFGTFRVIKQ